MKVNIYSRECRFSITVKNYSLAINTYRNIAPGEWLDKILNIFNSFHKRIQFTLEISDNNSINFLDVTISKKDN